MGSDAPGDFTQLIQGLREEGVAGSEATERVLEAVYPELRNLAEHLMRRERSNHTLQPTALVHEAYLKLIDDERVHWKDRAHFLGIAARAMRQVLVDHARRHQAEKRGGGLQRVTLDDALSDAGSDFEILSLHEALGKFAQVDERACRVVELKVFGGMKIEEIAHVLEVSKRTVDGDWAMARMWLGRELAS